MVRIHYAVLRPKNTNVDGRAFAVDVTEAANEALTAFQEGDPTREVVSATVEHMADTSIPYRLVIAYREG